MYCLVLSGLNNEVFDSYMLKSLDGVFEADSSEMYIVKRESDGKLMLKSAVATDINYMDQNPVREGYDRIIRCLGFKWDDSLFSKYYVTEVCLYIYYGFNI